MRLVRLRSAVQSCPAAPPQAAGFVEVSSRASRDLSIILAASGRSALKSIRLLRVNGRSAGGVMPKIRYGEPLNVLVAAKGHPYLRDPFMAMFDDLPGIACTLVEQPAAARLMNPEGMAGF